MKEFKTKNSSEQTFLQNQLILALIDPESVNAAPCQHNITELDDCDEEIQECQDMLQYYIATGNSIETKNWKRYLQEAKTRKRMIRRMIDEHSNEKEFLTT